MKAFAMGPGLVKTPLNVANMENPVAQKYMNMKAAFDAGKDIPPTVAAGIATEIASGRVDALVGRVFRPNDDFDKLEARADEIIEKDFLTLRLKT